MEARSYSHAAAVVTDIIAQQRHCPRQHACQYSAQCTQLRKVQYYQ